MGKLLREWVPTIVLALVLALTVRTFIAEARWVPSGSMLPTIEIGDRLLVDKISYRLHSVERGDVVVFDPPPAANTDEVLVKRVVGLPGETVAVRDGIVYVDDLPLDEPYIKDEPAGDFGPFTVPTGNVLVMGDNRNNSYDGRFWGPLPVDDIIGKAVICYYPLNRMHTLSDAGDQL